MFSMHSHSGQFCPSHAKDRLEDIVLRAISLKMSLFALTEHMPRTDVRDLYLDEIPVPVAQAAFDAQRSQNAPSSRSESIADHHGPGIIEVPFPIPRSASQQAVNELVPRHYAFLKEAKRLREKYRDQITILIGFEGEWIRPSYGPLIRTLLAHPDVDFFMGSIHHVHGIPIDFDADQYEQAKQAAGGSDERLFEDYFDQQYEMLQALNPKVVGHFDLIRLCSGRRDADMRDMKGVWARIVRNLEYMAARGALMECNSSALRKGLREPYPMESVVREYMKLGGMMTLSDDSHGIAQVGLNFGRALEFLEKCGVRDVWRPRMVEGAFKPQAVVIEELKEFAPLYPST